MKPNVTSANIIANVGPKPIKQIIFPLKCVSDIEAAKKANASEGFILSDTCSLMIVIEGATKNGEGKIKYTLSLEDDLDRHLVNLNHYTYVKLEENQSKNFTLNYNHPKPQNPSLEMIFDGKYGVFDVCIRVLAKGSHDEGKECDKKLTIDASMPSLALGFKRLFFHSESDLEKVKGVYNIEFTAKQHSGLIFGITEIQELEKTQHYLAREIKAGVPLTDTLRMWNGTMFYSFKLNPSLSVEAVRINLLPIKGDFTIAVRNDDVIPSIDQGFWVTEGDSLMLTKEDSQFKFDGIYTIGIFPKMNSRYVKYVGSDDFPFGTVSSDDYLKYKFQLTWSYNDKNNHLVPGIPDYGAMLQDTECFVFEISKGWTDVLVVKNSASKDVNMYALVSKPHEVPSSSHFDFRAVGDEAGFALTQADIQTHCAGAFSSRLHCNVHMCLYGKKHEDYMVGFTFNQKPFVLKDSKVFFGPSLKSDKKIHFIYRPTKSSPTDIEEFTGGSGASIAAQVMEEPEAGEVSFPTDMEMATVAHSSIIHITRASINQYKQPLIAITVGKAKETAAVPGIDYDFASWFGLEAGYYLKELSKGITRVDHIAKGQMAYFYFYNGDPTLDVVIGLDSLDGGDARMYMSRGRETRPTDSIFEKASSGFRSTFLTYSKRDSEGKGYTNMRGYYVLVVVALSDIKFSINWKHRSDQIEYGVLNYKRSTIIKPGKSVYVPLTYTLNEDIELHMNSHHRPLKVYYLRVDASNSSTANDLEKFPGPLNFKLKTEISARATSATVSIPKETECKGCKYLFTFTNEDTSVSVNLEYNFELSGAGNDRYPRRIHTGELVDDYFAHQKETRKYVLESVFKQGKSLNRYFEAHILTGSCEIKIANSTDMSEAGTKLSKSFCLGYHFISLDKSSTSANPGVNRGRGTSIEHLYIQTTCQEKSQIKFVVIEQDKHVSIRPNIAMESYLDDQEKEGDSFVYSATGNETVLNLNFQIDHFLEEKEVNLTNSALKNLVSVYFTKDQRQLADINSTSVKPKYAFYDSLNRRIVLEFKPRKGIFVLKIHPLLKNPFKYLFILSTEHLSLLQFGKYTIEHIGADAKDKIHEVRSQNSGDVYFKINHCFGQPQVFTSPSSNVTDKKAVQVDFSDNNRFVSLWSDEKPGETHFIQVAKSSTPDTPSEFGFLDYSKNVTVYGVEAIEKEGFESVALHEIRPTNDDIYMNLNSDPIVYFRPLNHHTSSVYYRAISYHVVVSRDPAVVRYYTNCEKVYLDKVLKKGYKISDAVQVFSTPVDPKPEIDSVTGLQYLKLKLNLASGHRYYLNIFADVAIARPHEAVNFQTIDILRVEYKEIEFEYTSFFYPLEWMAATFGLVAVMIATCWVIKNKMAKYLLKMTGFKPVASTEVDDELEDYYLQVRSHFEESEKQRGSAGSSANVSVLSTLERPTASKKEEPKPNQETELKELPKPETSTDGNKQHKTEDSPQEKEKAIEKSEAVEEDLFEGTLDNPPAESSVDNDDV